MLEPQRTFEPEPRTHEGYEWLYVLSGKLRLVLGEHDVVLTAGEAAEFNTRVPHAFGSRGRGRWSSSACSVRRGSGCTYGHVPSGPEGRGAPLADRGAGGRDARHPGAEAGLRLAATTARSCGLDPVRGLRHSQPRGGSASTPQVYDDRDQAS
ncbi:hypothetical protein SHIRM173S_04738 [Streptomyces hirsutus]